MKKIVALFALAVAAPLLAQNADVAPPPAGPAIPEDEDEGGLQVTVTDDSAWQYLGIAIPAFATNANVSTAANTEGTAALGRELARVITADLRNNGLFRPVGPDSLPRPEYPEITSPKWTNWQSRSAEMLVQGYVRANDDGRLTVGCYLYDVKLQNELVREGWVVPPSDWRRAAHKCADLVYSRLSGESPFFDSKIAYIAETGPKDHRIKRLAIMDSDGANHRFITNGQATALTPRYSPDYKQIVYLSYLNGNPSIYIYDIGTGKQHLVTRNSNPTFAPRWSPDGKW
ncbi:MAG TPA: Tol-Pal system protein TolB, partial [Sphingomonadaceae bacterium]|nr:Tol-Pal system protein TolB [Sphingomonadaceae bacterium]